MRLACLGAAALLTLACTESLRPGFDPTTEQFRVISPTHPELLQVIRLTPLRPAPGDTLRFDAYVINRGMRGIVVETRMCGLTVRGTLTLRDPFGRCGAFSARGTLAPGDTVRGGERLVVASAPGTYSLEVQHLIDPALWVPLTVTVRNP
jgi:hypothetical protein